MSRGSITRRGSSYMIKFELPRGADGKRRYRYASVKGSRQEAQKELTRLLKAADEGTLPDPSSATVAQYIDAWFANAHEQSPRTLERYKELADRQIVPHLAVTSCNGSSRNTSSNGRAPCSGSG